MLCVAVVWLAFMLHTSCVSFMKDMGDHLASGVKICRPMRAEMVDSMLTAVTTEAAVSATM